MIGFRQSPWILHYDASSCNGCDIEVLACLTPLYDVERLGVINTGNPKHADIFLVTGAVNEQSKAVICNIYHQLPEPKVVVAVGICAGSGGIFRECYNISGGVDSVIPVDVYVPGCAARPEAIIDGVVRALAVLEEKHRDMAATANSTITRPTCRRTCTMRPKVRPRCLIWMSSKLRSVCVYTTTSALRLEPFMARPRGLLQ